MPSRVVRRAGSRSRRTAGGPCRPGRRRPRPPRAGRSRRAPAARNLSPRLSHAAAPASRPPSGERARPAPAPRPRRRRAAASRIRRAASFTSSGSACCPSGTFRYTSSSGPEMATRPRPITASAQIRRGRPGTSSRTTRPRRRRGRQHAAGLAQHEQRAEHERAGRPEPGQHLAALLLGERHAGPEPEQEVARLPVHVAERVAQAAAEEERLHVAVEHAQHARSPPRGSRRPSRRSAAASARARCASAAGERRASPRRAPSARRSASAWSDDSAQVAESQDQSQRPVRPATASRGISRGFADVTAAAATATRRHADRDRPPDREVVEAVGDRADARAEAEQRQERRSPPSG